MNTSDKDTVSAAVLLIGDELLSGRTKDKNLGYIAEYLTNMAIEVREARFVADDEGEIVDALNTLRKRYDYVFTTGGIGPTHDDITADCVAKAFGVSIDHHPEAVELLKERYKETGWELNEARMRMARVPDGASLVYNPVSAAPGFNIENVYVMAGVPQIMQVMLDGIAPHLKTGKAIISRTVTAYIGEGDLAPQLAEIQEKFPSVSIGSYPFHKDGRFGSNIVLRSKDEEALEAAEKAVNEMVSALYTDRDVVTWS
ncbi:MAG: competence/damage-inducible protein A [Hyphomicrobiales bacterium]